MISYMSEKLVFRQKFNTVNTLLRRNNEILPKDICDKFSSVKVKYRKKHYYGRAVWYVSDIWDKYNWVKV